MWNWLPGFRAVAEHESVNKAADALHVSASALSRTVKLLESALGATLFVRRGSGLELTQLGLELLSITRDVMRQVDDCVAREEQRRGGQGPIHIGAASDLAGAVVARALASKLDGVVHVTRVDPELAAEELLHGNLDLVVTEVHVRPEDLVVTRLGEVTFGVYAKPGARPGVGAVAVVGMPEPADRQVVVRCDSIDVAVALCERAEHECSLPDIGWSSLVRLGDVSETTPLHALHRAPLPTGTHDVRCATLIERLAAVLSPRT